jgi:hypothetical protein
MGGVLVQSIDAIPVDNMSVVQVVNKGSSKEPSGIAMHKFPHLLFRVHQTHVPSLLFFGYC